MEIQEIKQRLSMATVLSHYGLKPDKHGRLCCPFHEDKTPSMQVYYKTQTAYCFSSNCKTNGRSLDVIDFIMYHENLDKRHAILKAAGMINGDAAPAAKAQGLSRSEILIKMFTYFKNAVYNSKPAQEYIQSRKLAYTKLEIGYNSGQFHHGQRKDETLIKQCLQVGLLQDAGLTSKTGDKAYKPFGKGCIVFPLRNSVNQVTGLYFRNTLDDTDKRHYYLKDRQGLYPCHPKADTQKLILTEAIIDAASLLLIPEITSQYSILACYGTNGLTEEHKQAIAGLKQLKEIIFFFDGDKAGKEAVKKYTTLFKELLPPVQISNTEPPEGEDINSLAQGHESGLFTHLLDTRTTLSSPQEIFSSIEEKKQGNDDEAPQEPVPSAPESPKHGQALDTKNPDYLAFTRDNLLISIIGGIGIYPLDKLKVTLKIERTDSRSSLHSIRQSNLDLYSDEQTEKLVRKAAERLETGTKPMQLTIAELVQVLEDYRLALAEAQKPKKQEQRVLTELRKRKAISYLSKPNLLEHTNEDIGKTGVIGEENNRLLMYLVFTSRLREQPLHIISLGASGTGKTYLQECVAELIPEEDKIEITALSENALYYFDRRELKHKLILIEDLDGASDDKILFAIRELMSKKHISKTVPIKDSKGNLKTITLHVEGPISLAGTTTREKLYEDNANRSLLIYLDGSQEQKENIMGYQRKLSAGRVNKQQEEELKEFFKDIQSVLQPIKVRNPFAEMLCIPEPVFKPLRTNAHYLAFIETITFYHQHQRPVKTDQATGEAYIETTLEDIQWANKLLKDVLLAKSDELTGACREFLETIKTLLDKANKTSFYKQEIREQLRINPHNLKYYLSQLLQYGYVKIIGGNKYKQGYEYEITSREEYTQLAEGVETALDKALQNIKDKMKEPEKLMRLTVANELN